MRRMSIERKLRWWVVLVYVWGSMGCSSAPGVEVDASSAVEADAVAEAESDAGGDSEAGPEAAPDSAGDADAETQADAGPRPQVAPDAALLASLQAHFEALEVPGMAACAVAQGAVLWCGGYGLANLETGRAVTADTPFLLASVSKVVTGTAALMLMERGEIALSDAVLDVAHPQTGAVLSWRQLLTHTSSIRDNWDAMEAFYVDSGDPTISLEAAVRGYLEPEGSYFEAENWWSDAPGSRHDYANMGTALQGLAVEVVAGEDFADWTDREIFAALGMADTSWRVSDFDEGALAMPYDSWGGALEPAGHYGFADYPNGALRSSARDMATFVAAWANGGALADGTRLLEASTVSDAITPQIPSLEPAMGLQWFVDVVGGAARVSHSGGEVGVLTEVAFRPDAGVGVVVLLNGEPEDEGPFTEVQTELLDWAQAASR